MFRAAPDHALYQGDVVIVPMVTLKDRDPSVITEASKNDLLKCGRCGGAYVEDYMARPARICGQCRAQEKVPREKRYTKISSRLAAKEVLFGGHAERVVAAVEVVPAMILSHSCDIDNADYIRFAPFRPLIRFGADQADAIRRRIGNLPYMYLEPGDDRDEGVVDLDHQFNMRFVLLGLRRTFFSKTKGGHEETALAPYVEAIDSRVLSLDLDGLRSLYEHIIRHLVRPKVMMARANPSDDALVDDTDRPQRKDLPTQGWWWPHSGWPRKPMQQSLDELKI